MSTVYSYTNYRTFLKDFFSSKKEENPHFSFQVFANKAGIKARDHILRVMNGQSNLSYEGSIKFASAMDLSEKEGDYFVNMVLFNQAKKHDEQLLYFNKMSQICNATPVQRLRQDQYAYFAEWYYAALRSFLPLFNFNNNYGMIGKYLDPPISAQQVRKAIDLLCEQGLLTVDENGNYKVAALSLTAGDEVTSMAINSFHRQSLELAIRSISKTPADQRDISGVTMSVSQKGFDKIKSEIQAFRKKIISIAENDSDEDRVVQFNMQLFPLSKKRQQ
ncbi:MAG TPA: TIGR02147 family protein [Chitinispirillaceae bacterium]|nr:TIGR02147 family protein [Chitinispirillaceae bacterium]